MEVPASRQTFQLSLHFYDALMTEFDGFWLGEASPRNKSLASAAWHWDLFHIAARNRGNPAIVL